MSRCRRGIMQRAERIVLVTVGTLAAAACEAPTAQWIVGVTMSLTGILSIGTALSRWHTAYRMLVVPAPGVEAAPTPEPVRPIADPGGRRPAPSCRAALMLNNVWVRRGFLLIGVGAVRVHGVALPAVADRRRLPPARPVGVPHAGDRDGLVRGELDRAVHLLEKRVPWPALFWNRLVGEGYNSLLPAAGIGGEPLKLRLLSTLRRDATARSSR